MRSLLLPLLLLLPAATVAQDLVAKTDALSPADEAKKFKLPPGFAAQLVASEPDIQKPMQMAFDAKGRLWVTTSHHYPFAVEPGKGTDKLFVLSDFDATGKAKKVEVFDDKLNIPIGVLPLPDGKSVIVSECGKILKLTDTTGKGKADKREVLFDGFGFRDTHGMTNSFTLLPDGWVYACHGYLNDSKVKGTDGHEVAMNSGNTFRFKPDGSRIEVFTRGQVNPFGIAVDPWLNLYTADCHSKPVTQLIRGAHYDSFGKPHDGLGYAPHVYQHLHNSTGLCGLTYYAADHFPKEWTGVLFVGNVVTSRINVDRVEWKGSTPVGKELADFLVSDDPWFRPVDIKLGPDGALYVSDFYNKVIGHYEVDLKHPGRDKDRGRVWRIVWTGTDAKAAAPTPHRTDWSQATAENLLTDFAHPNTTVRLLAANAAASRSSFKPTSDAVPSSTQVGLFAMARERTGEMSGMDYEVVIDVAKQNPSKVPVASLTGMTVRALTSRKEWGPKERAIALDCFKSFDSVRIKRAVIDGMTAHPDDEFTEALLDFIPTIPAEDTHLKHAARIALRNCATVSDAGWGSAVDSATKSDARLQTFLDVALAVPDKRAGEFLVKQFSKESIPTALRLRMAERIGRLVPDQARVVTRHKAFDADSKKAEVVLVRHAMTRALLKGLLDGGVKKLDDGAYDDVGSLVLDGLLAKDDIARETMATFNAAAPLLGPWFCSFHAQHAIEYALDPKRPMEGRVDAVEGLVKLTYKKLGNEQMREGALRVMSDSSIPSALREGFAGTMLVQQPTTAECASAKDLIKTAPYTMAVGLSVALAADKFGADLLLASVKSGEVPGRLLQEKAVIDRLKATKVPDLDAKLKELTKNIPAAEKRLDDLIKARAAGFPKAKADVVKGKEMFTKNCAVCHQLNNEGAKVGPQLDGLGIRGVERLLEDTLDPNRNVDHAFRATKLDLKDGRTLTGLLLREEGAVYVLADNLGKEQRVSKDDVDQKATGNASAMPANLDTVMTEAEYYHLLAFLLEQKPKK